MTPQAHEITTNRDDPKGHTMDTEHAKIIEDRLTMADVGLCALYYRNALSWLEDCGPAGQREYAQMSPVAIVIDLFAESVDPVWSEWHEYFALAFLHLAAPHRDLARRVLQPATENVKDLLRGTEELLSRRIGYDVMSSSLPLPRHLDAWIVRAIEVADAALIDESIQAGGEVTIIFGRVLALIERQPTCTRRGTS